MVCDIRTCVCGSCKIPQRYIHCVMFFLSVVSGYSMRVSFNIALTEIITARPPKNTTATDECPDVDQGSIKVTGGTYDWSVQHEGMILSAFFPGYVISHIPGGYIADTYGGKHVLGTGIGVSALMSFFVPLIIQIGGWWLLMISRFFTGLAQGCMFPVVGNLLAKWVPKKERSTLGALVLSGSQIGTITGNLISALLITYVGNWQVVFYFWGAVGIVWYILFMILCSSEPAKHIHMTEEEAEMLATEIGPTDKLKVPWVALLTYPPVLALMMAQIGHDAVFFLMVTDLPKYMKDVLKFNIRDNGILTSVPFVGMWVCGGVTGIICDTIIRKEIASVVVMRKIYTTVASFFPSLCCLLASYMGCNRFVASAMFVVAMFTMGPYYSGMRVNGLDITKNFSGIVTACVNGAGALAFVPVPYLIGIMTKNRTSTEWQGVFWMIFVLCQVTNVIYLIWGSADRAEWDKAAQ